MFNLILNAKTNAKIAEAYDQMAHDLGEAIVLLKEAAVKTHALSGELYGSAKGALLVSVPNALVRGAFSAIDENGLMLPNQGKFNAHIVVMTPEEVSKIGGLGKITERGKHFHYNLGPLHEGPMTSSFDFSRVWFLSVSSPELTQLRKTYGLDSGPGKHGFNIVVALRRLGVLGKNEVTKLADTSSTKLLGLLKQSETDLIRAAKAKEVLKAIKQFSKQRNIDPNQALLLAGGSMYFRGLKDNINDIDFMHPGLKDFTKQTIGKYELDGGPGGMPEDAYASDKLYGLNVQRPEAILSFYKFLNRPKDQQKIQMLEGLVSSNKTAATADLLPGGKADNVPDKAFNSNKLEKAKKHEMEHTNNPALAKEVAKDHMVEDEDYYQKLEKMEKKEASKLILSILKKSGTIRTRMGHESDADVVTPAAEDVAFLENKPATPKEKKKEPSENTAKVRNAVVDATKETFGVDPTYKKAQWAEVLKKLKEFGNS